MNVGIGGEAGSRIQLHEGTDGCPESAPYIIGGESGYACLRYELEGNADAGEVRRLADAMRNSDDGAWLALVDAGDKRLVIVQSNRPSGGSNFYVRNHGQTGGPIWRDFYHRMAYVAFSEADARWRSADIRLGHPTGHGWPPDLAPATIEGLGHLLDDKKLSLQTVYFETQDGDGCGIPSGEIDRARQVLIADQAAGGSSAFPVDTEEVPLDELSPGTKLNGALVKVDVLTRPSND